MMLSQHKLAVILSLLRENPNPEYKLEQYSITPGIAASILFLAKKDIKNKIVYDLGCGSGRLGIGSALLGAKEVFFLDIDEDILNIAKKNAKLVEEKTGIKISKKCKWICCNVENLFSRADTVIQFPPFTMDVVFLRKALQIAKNVYSIHKLTETTKRKIKNICKKFNAKIKLEKNFRYKLPWKEKEKIGYEVFLLVAKH